MLTHDNFFFLITPVRDSELTPIRIIGLYGLSCCGKSATLNILKELLREAGKSLSSSSHPYSETPETFEYKGMVICVAPGGDSGYVVGNNLKYFNSKNCDIAFTATRCKGGSVETLQRYEQETGATIEWFQKSYEHNLKEETRNLCNHETANLLFEMI